MKLFKKIKNLLEYFPIIWNDEDWDYAYMLDIIEYKLKRMSKYFLENGHLVNNEQNAKRCQTAINILHAGYLTDVVTNEDLTTYVNVRNISRYKNLVIYSKDSEFWNTYGKASVREEKAKKLFWKYLNHYIEYFWD